MPRFFRLDLLALVLLPLGGIVEAHTLEAPVTVPTDSNGCFEYSAQFTVGPGSTHIAFAGIDGSDNTDTGILIADYFCINKFAEGEQIDFSVAGCLIDTERSGSVTIVLSTCDNEVFSKQTTLLPPLRPFLRSDVNGDGDANPIPDALFLLTFAFAGGPAPPCLESADVNGDGVLGALADAIYALNFGFSGGPPPAPPYPECGDDPEPEGSLGCDASPCGP